MLPQNNIDNIEADSESDEDEKNAGKSVEDILARSKQLSARHFTMSVRYRQKLGNIPKDYDTNRDPNVLNERDWLQLISQKPKLSKS